MSSRALSHACWLVVAAGLLLACTPADVPNPNTACEDYVGAYCDQLASCSALVLAERFGTLSNCLILEEAACEVVLATPSTASAVAGRERCAAALDAGSWDCADLLLGIDPPTACAPASGPLATGSACSQGSQCQSSFCSIPNGTNCGVCAPIPSLGASCATAPCGPQQVCSGDPPICLNHPVLGGACQPPSGLSCSGGAFCAGSSNSMTGVCLANPGATVGASCDFTGLGCDSTQLLTCNAATMKCEMLQISQPGEACGIVDDQSRPCAAATCVDGACVANPGPGEACQVPAAVSGPGVPTCVPTTRCISLDGGAEGVCAPHTPNDCASP